MATCVFTMAGKDRAWSTLCSSCYTIRRQAALSLTMSAWSDAICKALGISMSDSRFVGRLRARSGATLQRHAGTSAVFAIAVRRSMLAATRRASFR